MRIILLLVASIIIVACAGPTPPKREARDPPKPLSEKDKSYISTVERDGRLMYEKDIRAANATDLLLVEIDPADYPNLVGWVTYPNVDDFTVSFYQKNGEEFEIIADVIYSKSATPVVDLVPNRKPTALEVSMVQARVVALQNGASSCSDRHKHHSYSISNQ